MISSEQAQQFAASWIAAWNAHDLNRILAHYTDDFEMSSPKIISIAGESSGQLWGKTAVGDYWKRALALRPDLHFRLLAVFPGVRTICVHYESLDGHPAVEWFEFNEEFQIIKAAAHYDGALKK